MHSPFLFKWLLWSDEANKLCPVLIRMLISFDYLGFKYILEINTINVTLVTFNLWRVLYFRSQVNFILLCYKKIWAMSDYGNISVLANNSNFKLSLTIDGNCSIFSDNNYRIDSLGSLDFIRKFDKVGPVNWCYYV